MGSHMKKAIFEEQTATALKKWHQAAKNRKKLRKAGAATDTSTSNANFTSGETTPGQGSSPLHLLHSFQCRSSAPETESQPASPTSHQTDTELSDLEAYARGPTHDAASGSATDHRNVDPHREDFSFVKLQLCIIMRHKSAPTLPVQCIFKIEFFPLLDIHKQIQPGIVYAERQPHHVTPPFKLESIQAFTKKKKNSSINI